MPATWYPERAFREYLIAWPAGETRQLYATPSTPQAKVILPAHARYRLLRRCTREGYLTYDTVSRWSNYTRTAKVMPAPRAVRERTAPRRYVGTYPWSVDAHWAHLCSTGPRGLHNILAQLKGGTSTDSFGVRTDSLVKHGWLVGTKSQLSTARQGCELVFNGGIPRGDQILGLCYAQPQLLQLLLIDMDVRPEFDTAGTFVRFVTGNYTTEARAALWGTGATPLARWQADRNHTLSL